MCGSLGEAPCRETPGGPLNGFMVRNSRVSCKGREEWTPKAKSQKPKAESGKRKAGGRTQRVRWCKPAENGSNGRLMEAESSRCTHQRVSALHQTAISVFDWARPPRRPERGQAHTANSLRRFGPSWRLAPGVCFFERWTAKWGFARHAKLGLPGARHCPTRCRCP